MVNSVIEPGSKNGQEKKASINAGINTDISMLSMHLEELTRLIQTRLVSETAPLPASGYTQIEKEQSTYAHFLRSHKLSFDEQTILLLALIPHIRPDFFYETLKAYQPGDGNLAQIGGIKDESQQYFLPTGETALFILAGHDLTRRFEVQKLFVSEHVFSKLSILSIAPPKDGEPHFGGRLILDSEYIDLFTLGAASTPALSINFPAQKIETKMDWDDLVLNNRTRQQIDELKIWVKHNDYLMEEWGMEKKLKPGFRALFYGPPGTGKTLTAGLLGKYTNRDVFRVDLSMVVSKFIGETEKNLSRLFDKAKNKDWILFFDEADSLFGKRTEVSDAHDRYANQEVSYLLQRVENYAGLVILSSNFKTNIDEAFTRRFNAIVHFPRPNSSERLHLWEKAFPKQIKIDKSVDFFQLANKYELTGANIMNIVQHTCLQTLAKERKTIAQDVILQGIKKEMVKEGKVI